MTLSSKVVALPSGNVIIEIEVRPATFRVTTYGADWEEKTEDERRDWCEQVAQEFDRIHFNYRKVAP